MRIADVRTVPFWDGRRNTMVVVVETDDGLVGLGEAGIGAHLPAIAGVIATFKPWLVGQDACPGYKCILSWPRSLSVLSTRP